MEAVYQSAPRLSSSLLAASVFLSSIRSAPNGFTRITIAATVFTMSYHLTIGSCPIAWLDGERGIMDLNNGFE